MSFKINFAQAQMSRLTFKPPVLFLSRLETAIQKFCSLLIEIDALATGFKFLIHIYWSH